MFQTSLKLFKRYGIGIFILITFVVMYGLIKTPAFAVSTKTWTSYNDFNFKYGSPGDPQSTQPNVTINGSGSPTDAIAGKVTITQTTGSKTQTSDTDFNGGTLNQLTVSGSGAGASIGLSQSPGTSVISATLPNGGGGLSSCAQDSSTNKIYCFGGYDLNWNSLDQIVEYDPATGSVVTKSAKLPTARGELSCAENSSTHLIYCFGGYQDLSPWYLSQIVEYNPATDSVAIKTGTLPRPRYGLTCTENSSTHKFYCLGGRSNISPTYPTKIVEYDPVADVAVEKTGTIAYGSYGYSCAENSSTNKIYCFGGGYNTVFEYDPSTDIRIDKSTLPIDIEYTSCTEVPSTHKIYCLGGYDDTNWDHTDKIYEYDSVANSVVTKTATLPFPLEYHSCATNSSTNKIYCFGGEDVNWNYTDQIVEYDPANPATGYRASGDLTSSAFDTGQKSNFTTLDFTISKPANTDLKFQLRSANTSADLSSATWYGPTGTGDYYTSSGTAINPIHNGQWIQYKAFFTTTDPASTVTLSDITINFNYIPPPLVNQTITQTSDTDFSSGTLNQVVVNGTGANAEVDLTTFMTDLYQKKSSVLPVGAWPSCAQDSSTNKIYCFGGVTNDTYNPSLWPYLFPTDLNTITEYDPATGSVVTKTAVLPTVAASLSCVENSSTHKIYCLGGVMPGGYLGLDYTWLNQIVEYTPATDTLAVKSAVLPTTSKGTYCAEDSLNHKIYCFGGIYIPKTIIEYDPATDTITTKSATLPYGSDYLGCAENSATHLIYCFGGYNGTIGTSIFQYDPAADSLTVKSSTLPKDHQYTGCSENSLTHKIYCFMRNDLDPLDATIYEYDSSLDSLVTKNPVYYQISIATDSCLENSSTHKFYCIGGRYPSGYAEIAIAEYDPNPQPWYIISPNQGIFTSAPLDTGTSPIYKTLSFNISKPANTYLNFKLRSATTLAGLSSATWWGNSSGAINYIHQNNRWIQYQAIFVSQFGNDTPALNDITINYDGGYPAIGTISGIILDTSSSSSFGDLSWNADTPSGTNVKFRTRSANSEANLSSAAWSSYYTTSPAAVTSPANRYIELEITLDTSYSYSTPTINDVSLAYTTSGGSPTPTPTPTTTPPPSVGKIYRVTGDLTVNSDITVNKTGVIFVDGNLYINTNLTNINPETGLVFVVQGTINIQRDVTTVNAFLIAHTGFCSAWDGTTCADYPDFASQKYLTINGAVISLNANITPQFVRKKATLTNPAETINYEPKYLVILKDIFSRDLKIWKEIQ